MYNKTIIREAEPESPGSNYTQPNDDDLRINARHVSDAVPQTEDGRAARRLAPISDHIINSAACPETIKRQEVHKILDNGF